MFELAELLQRRPGMPAKSPQVWNLYTRAAEAGDWRAMKALAGRRFLNVDPRARDWTVWEHKAAEATRQRAMAGDIDAMNEMARRCDDEAKAIAWYRKSADKGDADAMYGMAILLIRLGQGLGDDSPGLKWMRRAADLGNVPAMLFMAKQRVFAKPWPANGEAAIGWYAKAADAGNADAMRAIGDIYRDGKMVAADGARATEWYEKAAVADGRGLCRIGDMYANGEAVAKDDALALKWYLKSAEAGEAEGMNALGKKYQAGLGVAKDRNEAVRWFTLAADAGSDDAEQSLTALNIERLPRVFNTKLAEVYLPDGKFKEDISFFEETSRTNFYFDWKKLGRVGVTPQLPLDLRLDDVTLKDAFDTYLEKAGHGKIGYAMIGGVVIISTPEGIESRRALHDRHLSPPADANVARQLNEELPDAKFEDMPLSDALDFLRDVAQLTFRVDWAALNSAGVTANTPTTVNLTHIRAQCALETILYDAGGQSPLDYEVRDGVVVISMAKPTAATKRKEG
jgi:hypothetical protein